MTKWEPTMQLRWSMSLRHQGETVHGDEIFIRVLQQLWTSEVPWEKQNETTGPVQREWRDVPTEE